MKKILLATAAVALTAGAASADGISLSGYGRFGITYNSTVAAGTKKAQVTSRFNIDVVGTKTTDSGVEFGAKFRIRANQGDALAGTAATAFNSAKFWAKTGGFTLEVGNISDAIDAMSTIWNSEVGLNASSAGDPAITFTGYSSQGSIGDAVGVGVSYAVGSVIVRATHYAAGNSMSGMGSENAVSVDYSAGDLSLGAGYVSGDAAYTGVAGGLQDYIVSAEYKLGQYNIGALYQDGDTLSKALVTLYGNTKFGATTVSGYIASGAASGNDTAVGLGLGYDIGGATLLGSVQHQLSGNNYADFGVKFSF